MIVLHVHSFDVPAVFEVAMPISRYSSSHIMLCCCRVSSAKLGTLMSLMCDKRSTTLANAYDLSLLVAVLLQHARYNTHLASLID
jgi:hypothetical protein